MEIKISGNEKFNPLDFEVRHDSIGEYVIFKPSSIGTTWDNILRLLKENKSYGLCWQDGLTLCQLGDW